MTLKRHRPAILRLACGAWVGQAIRLVAELRIADLVADRPRTVAELAQETGSDPSALRRVLRALASVDIFQVRADDKVELSALAEPLRSDHPDSVRMFAILMNGELYEAFGDLGASVRTGDPAFDVRFGTSMFEYHDSHPDAAATFHQGMHEWGRWDTADILAAYDFGRFRKVVDVGGGNGMFLSALLARQPRMSGVLLDRPAGIQAAKDGLGGPLPRCELIAGDFLAEAPRGGDLYVVKHVLVDWPDREAVTILRNCRAAMADGGRVLVLDSVVDGGRAGSFGHWLDLLMMVVTGGKFRTEAEFSQLFTAAGLRLSGVTPVSESITLLEGVAA